MASVSVVIPVYNEEKNIRRTLKAIFNNSVQPNEVIVADGGSTDRTLKIIKLEFPQVMIVHNTRKTAASGRNEGIKAASGEIIAFTDGDCLVDVNWIKNIKNAFAKYGLDGLGGKVLNAQPENHIEAYWGNLAWNLIMNFGDDPYQVTEQTLNDAFVTANCAYKRKFLMELKGFNNWFGNNAEDVDLCWRAIAAKGKLMYIPDVVIYAHNVTTVMGVAKKSFRNGYSSSKLQKVYGTSVNYDWNIYKMLWKNIKGIPKHEKDSGLNTIELACHLAGKYYGSFKVGIINI